MLCIWLNTLSCLQVISKQVEAEESVVYGCSEGVGIEDGYGMKTKIKNKKKI